MRRRHLVLLASVLIVAIVGLARADAPETPPADWLLAQVKALAAPALAGRASGTRGADLAARHIAAAFKEAGLQPGGDAGDFRQAFDVPTGIRLGAVNALTLLTPRRRAVGLGRDFTPLAVSADGDGSGEVVFVGYGITAPDLGYDDYAGLDVGGRIVLAMTGEPRGRDPASPFRRPEAYHYSERSHKVINAREHGARAVLLVARPGAARDTLPPLRGITQPWGIQAASITRATAEALLAPTGRRLETLADAIDQALAPRSAPLTGVTARLQTSLVRERGVAANVIGILPGTHPTLRDETIVVGAHYDHLGRGGEGSLAPDAVGAVHPGADDNASGTAAVLGLARAFAAAGGAPRTLVFVAFSGEEMGLLGSAHYVRHPALPLETTAAMVNLDMVGRLRNDTLYVGGVDSGSGLRRIVTAAAQGLDLTLQARGDPFAPSDHTSFYTAGRPVLFIFTGAHDDYHRPSDTWDKINAGGLATVTTFVARVVAALAAEPAAPVYAKMTAPPREVRGGYGPFFGVIPDFGEAPQPGVRITGVRPGSPADKAGVQPGDVLVRFAGVSVGTLNDMTFVLRAHRPGDTVEVVVVRGGHEERLHAVLEERR
jgi:peptidase M28-like protein/PDZ domain-containing protein/PA domain-containing protein